MGTSKGKERDGNNHSQIKRQRSWRRSKERDEKYIDKLRRIIDTIARGFMDDEQQLRHERDPYNKYGRSTWFLHTKRRTCCQLHSPWLTLKAINPIQDDIMVISVEITNCIVRTTLVDQGSSVDILFWNTFKRMGITEFKILPHDDPYLAVSEKGLGRKEVFGCIPSLTIKDHYKKT